jgi:hypothetical protein
MVPDTEDAEIMVSDAVINPIQITSHRNSCRNFCRNFFERNILDNGYATLIPLL